MSTKPISKFSIFFSQFNNPNPTRKPLVTHSEVTEMLGIDYRKLTALLRNNEGPKVKFRINCPPVKVYYDKKEMMDWIKSKESLQCLIKKKTLD